MNLKGFFLTVYILYFSIVLFWLAVPTKTQELATLTTPVSLGNITSYEISSVELSRFPTWNLKICYRDNFQRQLCDIHEGIFHATNNPNGADVLVKTENKFNHSTNSLEKRAFLHLIAEGKIPASSITGAPQ